MVFLKKDDHAVSKLNALRLLRMKCRKRRLLNGLQVGGCKIILGFCAGGGLGSGSGAAGVCRLGLRFAGCWFSSLRLDQQRTAYKKSKKMDQAGMDANHYYFSFCGCAASLAGDFFATFSITATVRLPSTNVLLATRRTSALVTLSIWSTCRNNSRQSPKRN